MKKILVLSLMLGTLAFVVPSTEAAPTAAAVQYREQDRRWNRDINRSWNRNRRTRVVTRTRTVRIGNRWYRERIRITYFANGRQRIQVLSRTRIR